MSSVLVRRVLRLLLVLMLCVVAAEATVRIFYARSLGPRTLLYGTSWYRNQFALPATESSAQSHENVVGNYQPYASVEPTGYAKYFPNEVKYTDSPDHRESYPIRINNRGFRGPDFTIEKPPGVVRVLTLGASSTFGYHDRDDETYPYYLQQLLNADGGRRYEVINFAIPHATSANIAAMLIAEGFALQPDVVTFYEGVNDAGIFENARPPTGWRRVWTTIGTYSLLAQLADQLVRPPVGEGAAGDWSDAFAERRSRDFLANLGVIARACAEHGVRFIVATQQAKSELIEASAMRGVTYGQEVALVKEKLSRGEIGPPQEGMGPRNPVLEVVSHLNPARILLG
jgi:lysophospholipase L1-like esterase